MTMDERMHGQADEPYFGYITYLCKTLLSTLVSSPSSSSACIKAYKATDR